MSDKKTMINKKEDYINITIDFINKFGYEKLAYNTKYNSLKIGQFRTQQRRIFKKLVNTKSKERMIKEFNIIHPYYLENRFDGIFEQEYIKVTIDFIEKYGYKKLSYSTKHNGLDIGKFRSTQRRKFKKLKTIEEKEEMINKFNCIHSNYLID